MKKEIYENIKITTFIVGIVFILGTIMAVASEIDGIENGESSVGFLIIIFGCAAIISIILHIWSSSKLKKLEGDNYVGTLEFIQFFFLDDEKDFVSDCFSVLPAQSSMWRYLCSGYYLKNVILFVGFVLLFLMISATALVSILGKQDYLLFGNKGIATLRLNITTYMIMLIILMGYFIFLLKHIKVNPSPIYYYLQKNNFDVKELSKEFEQADSYGYCVWISKSYLFMVANAKSYCIPLKEIKEIKIEFGIRFFIFTVEGSDVYIVRVSFLPFGFLRLKKLINEKIANEKDL